MYYKGGFGSTGLGQSSLDCSCQHDNKLIIVFKKTGRVEVIGHQSYILSSQEGLHSMELDYYVRV
jgi:hypothetical protein